MTDLIVFSGGLDSTVCLWSVRAQGVGPPLALTFDYGQSHRIELERASLIAAEARTEHLVVTIDTTGWGGSALVGGAIDVPDAGTAGTEAIPLTYVPARNLVFLSMALAIAEARGIDRVHIGVNALDYSGYPDCRPEFIEAFRTVADLALKRAVEGRPVELVTPLIDKSKAQIARMGADLGAPLGLTWSCYRSGPDPCRTCDACVLRAKGFAEAGIADPALR